MSEREFNLPAILADNVARFARVTPSGVFYYVWVLDSNQALIHRGPMKAFEFQVIPEQLQEAGELGPGEPAARLGPSIALAIAQGTFRAVPT